MTTPATSQKEEPWLVAVGGGREFKIVADKPDIGFYLYVFEGKRCTHDYLQETEEKAKECAKELFGVPLASWQSKPFASR